MMQAAAPTAPSGPGKVKLNRRVHLRAAQRVLLKDRAAVEKARRADERWLGRTGRKADAALEGCA